MKAECASKKITGDIRRYVSYFHPMMAQERLNCQIVEVRILRKIAKEV